MSKRRYYLFAVLVMMLGAGLRLWDFTALPAGFSNPELAQIDVMRDQVQRGDIRVFYELDTLATVTAPAAQEGLFHHILALTSLAFGEGTFGLRVLSLHLGLVTLALLYSLGSRLYGSLAGIAAALLVTVMMWPVLLSRLVLAEAALPALVTAILLSMARSLPVYRRSRAATTNTTEYAILGVLVGLSLYLHPGSLMIVLLFAGFITYLILLRRPMSLRRLSYIGFAVLMLIIISLPYILSTLRLPELAASGRVFGVVESLPAALYNTFIGIGIRGDMSALTNLAGRPLIDPISAFLALLGLIVCLRNWRDPRYMLLLMAVVLLGLPATFATDAPNFLAMTIFIPVLALLFGLGLSLVLRQMPRRTRPIGVTAMLALLVINVAWMGRDLFVVWPAQSNVQTAYNAELGQIAAHIDRTADEIPTVLCYRRWDEVRLPLEPLTRPELVMLHMNRDTADLRHLDCSQGFLFVNAGQAQQVVIANPDFYNQMPPIVLDWLALGTPVETAPDGTVVQLAIQDTLFDALGVFTTTSPASLATADDVSTSIPVAPEIRFGGNLTWLGYETDPAPIYRAGDLLEVTTYWRIEGLVPSDLVIFTHVLRDPVTLAANRDTIAVNPEHLRERDVYLHIADIPLPQNIPAGDYVISVGGYQQSDDARLPVFGENNTEQGRRIFLYNITVNPPPGASN